MSTTSSRRRGIVTHDHRISVGNIDATETSADQAGPYPGPAVDTGSSAMVLRTSGTMAADQSYTITARRGGMPGNTKRSAGISYNNGVNEFYWDPPGVLTGVEFVNFHTSGGGTSDGYKEYEPSLCVLASGMVLMAVRGKVVATSEVYIRIRSYNPDTNTWTILEDITDTTIDDSQRIGPCLVLTPDGVVHLYYYVAADTQIAHWVSGDSGATWTKASSGCCTSSLQDYTGSYDWTTYGMGIKGAYSNGHVVLMCGAEGYGTNDSYPFICTSSDNGYTFQPDIEYAANDSDYIDYKDIGCTPMEGGGFRIAFGSSYVSGIGADVLQAAYIEMGSGYYDFRRVNIATSVNYFFGDPYEDAASSETVEGGVTFEHSACTWNGEDGTYYFGCAAGNPNYSPAPDRGAFLIERVGEIELSPHVINHGSGTAGDTFIRRPVAVETRGMTMMASQVGTATGQIGDGTIVVWYLGGHSTMTIPPASASDPNSMARVPFNWQFHAITDPDDGGTWTSGASTGSMTLEKAGMHLSCTNTQQYFFAPNSGEEPADESSELLFEIALSGVVSAGHTGSINQPRCGALLTYRHSAGSAQYTVLLNTSATGITLYDTAGSASLGTASVDLSGEVEIRVALYRGRINAWYREVDSRVERAWTQVVTNGSVTGAAVSVSTHVVQWGMISTAASGTHEMTISRVQVAQIPAGTLASTGIASLAPYPRPMPASPITIPGGLRLEAIDGPAASGDSWAVNTAYYYGFENLFTDNPAQVWRSTQDNTTMRIAFDLSGFSSAAGMLEAFAFGAALLNSNVKDWRIQIQTNTAKGTNVDWMLVYAQPFAVYEAPAGEEVGSFAVGNVVYPDGGGEPLRWIEHNELAGCQIFDVGADRSFRIIGNSSGEWAGEYTHREAYAYLHPDDSPELYDGGSGAYIHLRNSAGFIWDAPPTGTRWLVLTIPGQRTYEGYYEIGRFIAGPLRVFGREYSEDRALEQRSNVELTTRRDGSRYAHSRGPQRRSVTISWREGVDETALYSTLEPKEVPFVSGFTPAEAVANPADTVKLVRGLFHEADGATEPILYLPSIPTNIQSGSLTARDALLYGRIVSQIEIGQILGNEEENQVHRLGAIRIEEEIG